MTPAAQRDGSFRLAWLVFWVSAAVLGFEIVLMRLLLVSSWNHFAFVVISVVLLGFGASGTALTVARAWVLPRSHGLVFVLSLLTAGTMPICAVLAQHVPIEARFVPALLAEHAARWVLYWAILTIPFFFGAAGIGLALMSAKGRIAGIYASNLLGSGAGALLAPVLMTVAPPQWLPLLLAGPAVVGGLSLAPRRASVRYTAWTVLFVAVTAFLVLDPPHLRLDSSKYAAQIQQWAPPFTPQRIAHAYGPRATVEVYRSEAIHDLPFLGLGEPPPPISAIVIDGHRAGSVLNVASAAEASVVERTLMAAPYAFAPDQPRVALLGEIGGSNAWLAVRRGAASIDVVQPYPAVFEVLRGPLREDGGAVLAHPLVHPICAEPRHFIEHTPNQYDLIQVVALESSAAGSGGVAGLGQDFLMTEQGITACLETLRGDGLLFACRGIQTPPRDNLKVLATLIRALAGIGVTEPDRHIVIVRDFLAVCTIVKVSPWTSDEIDRLRELCRRRQLTPVWFQGIRDDELNQPDALESPPDGVGDWYHYAARNLFSSNADRFIDDWKFDIRPATDDRPFFYDYFKLRSLRALKDAYGELWLTRTELAFLFIMAAAIIVSVVGAALILAPLAVLRGSGLGSRRFATLSYFAAIGLAYLLLEMTLLSALTRAIGDPVLSAAVTIAGFLIFSGAGSLTAQRLTPASRRTVARLFALLLVICGLMVLVLNPLASLIGGFPEPLRLLLAPLAIAPLGYLMGFPMPLALAQLERAAPSVIPWAWGINGFASVVATPLAMMIGMTWGFTWAGIAAIGLYGAAALVFTKLSRR